MIAVLAEGALRDAISILERCIQDANNETIDENKIRNLVGIPELEYISKISKALLEKDVSSVIDITKQIMVEGKDLDNFLWEIIKYIKDVLIFKVSNHLDLYTDDEIKVIKQIATVSEKENFLSLIYNLSKLANDMKYSTQKSLIFETGLLKECMTINTVMAPEEKLPKPSTSSKELEVEQKEIKEKKTVINKKSESSSVSSGDSLPYWPQVLEKLKSQGKMMLYANLLGTSAIQINDMTVEIKFPKKITDFAKKVLEEHENRDIIAKLISLEAGQVMQIRFSEINKETNDTKKNKTNEIENIAQELDIPFDIIDD